LRFENADLRLSRTQRGRRRIDGVLCGCVLPHEIRLALLLLLGEGELSLPVGELRFLGAKLRAVCIDAREVNRRIDLRQQLAGFDGRADLHVELLQLSGDLRAHIHVIARLEDARRRDRVLEVAALHDRSRVLALARLVPGRGLPREVAAAEGEGDRERERRALARDAVQATLGFALGSFGCQATFFDPVHLTRPERWFRYAAESDLPKRIECGRIKEVL
jgi:hypothetical protein